MQWEGFSYNGQALHVHDCVYNVHSRMPYRRIHQIHAGTVLSTLNSHIIKIKPGKKHPSLNRESNPRPPAFRAGALTTKPLRLGGRGALRSTSHRGRVQTPAVSQQQVKGRVMWARKYFIRKALSPNSQGFNWPSLVIDAMGRF